MTLTFDDGSHLYKLDGVKIPSVTQIISEAGLSSYDDINPELLEKSAIIGKHVHLACELDDRNELDLENLDPLYKMYLDAWREFKKNYNFQITEIELQLFHDVLRYAGRIDRIGYIGKDLTIIDIKTGMSVKSNPVQTAGYMNLYNFRKLRKDQAKKRMCVFIKPTGYKVEEHTNNTLDESVFLAALTITNYKRRK